MSARRLTDAAAGAPPAKRGKRVAIDRGPVVSLRPPRLLLYLDAVARLGSVRKAAGAVHVAPSALDRRILDLEAELGTPLFERLARGLRPTAAGEVYLAYVRRALADVDATRSQIEALHGLVRGEVRIASAESVGSDLLPQVIAEFQVRHPGVRFQVTVGGTDNLLGATLDDRTDLMLAHDPPRDPGLAVMADIAQPLCALLRPDHPLAGRKIVRFDDCLRYPLALGDESFGSRRLIDPLLDRSAGKAEIVFVSNSVESLKAATRRTGAISFQFEAGTRRDAFRGELVARPLSDRSLASGRLVLAARSSRVLPIASAAFAESLAAALNAY